jgi:integrase
MATPIKFTDRALAALPIPTDGQRAEWRDTETDGLRLRVSPHGVKTFSLLRRIKQGPMERVTLGRFGDIKTEQARTRAKSLNGKIADGANPAELKRALKGEPTFAQLFAEYLERHAKLKKRTWRDDEQQYRDYLSEPLGKKKLSRVTRQDLAAIHSQLTRAGHPTLANRVKDLYSSIFGRAAKWGYLDVNPAKGIEDNRETPRDRFLQPGELPRLFEALADEPNQAFRDYFLLALLTGARRANVRMMRWADLDLAEGKWHIPVTKNGQPHDVPLIAEAVTILRERLKGADDKDVFVFPAARSDSKHGHMSGERKAWLRMLDRDELTQLSKRIEASGHKFEQLEGELLASALDRARVTAKRLKLKTDGARLENIRIHDLRRTLGSWQARTGASLVIIGKSLGHKNPQTTAVYARLDLDPVRESMERAGSAILVAARAKPAANVRQMKTRSRRR